MLILLAAEDQIPAPQLGFIETALALRLPQAWGLLGAFGCGASPQPAEGWLLSEVWSQHQFLWRRAWAASSGTSTAGVWVDAISF